MSVKENNIVLKAGNIPESTGYFETKADSVVTVGTNIDGDEILTLVFLNNYPIVENVNGSINVTDIEKRRVASISIGKNQAKKFYESLKSVFDSE